MRTVTVEVFQYSELSDKAKEKARDWYREADAGDNYFAESVTESFTQALEAFGFDVRERDITWSGFWSQGDGASFSGNWRPTRIDADQFLKDHATSWIDADGVRHECKQNAELHRIAAELLACKAAGLMYAAIRNSSRGHFMQLDDSDFSSADDAASAQDFAQLNAREFSEAENRATEKRFIEAARDLAAWFYRALESEYNYHNSDEVIAETIEANGYEFNADGSIY